DGVCLAVNSLCADDQDCNSSVFNACSSDVSTIGLNVPLKGSFCIQTNCKADGTACTPGSSCIRNILGSLTQVPDVCAPNCVPHSPDDGGVRNYECVPGFLCLTTAFPQQTARVCAPGQAGWLCNDSLDCSAGKCQDWSDVSPSLAGLTACAPKCNTDDDCTRYDNGGNPTFISKLTCHAGGCRAQLTLLYADQCFQVGQPCSLDTGAACSDVRPFGGMPLASTDGGVPAAAGGRCLRGCANDGDCAPLTAVSHVPHLCDVVDHTCTPAVPFVAHCASDASCTGGLHCIPGLAACTRACSTESDCTNDPALGSAFTCPAGLCVPKKSSGEKAPASQCLSGTSDPMTGVCVSPSGWSCDDDAQCVSHNCKPIGPDSTDGRCE
ncbi:MAG TPA: hypothetical protein VFF06_34545, partial [Polyangia bacterium]|nr:hypothetical protein [Polyangia bacterium]